MPPSLETASPVDLLNFLVTTHSRKFHLLHASFTRCQFSISDRLWNSHTNQISSKKNSLCSQNQTAQEKVSNFFNSTLSRFTSWLAWTSLKPGKRPVIQKFRACVCIRPAAFTYPSQLWFVCVFCDTLSLYPSLFSVFTHTNTSNLKYRNNKEKLKKK